MGVPRQQRITREREFALNRRSRNQADCGYFALRVNRRNVEEPPRFAVIASRKVGNAVARNRGKRRLRELFMQHQATLPAGADLVAVLRKSAPDAAFGELERRFLKGLERLRHGL